MKGKSNASKEEMISAVKCEGFNPETDDEVDTIAIMLLAQKETINNAKKTGKSKNESFQALKDSGSRDPAISLASEFFFLTLLYSKMRWRK